MDYYFQAVEDSVAIFLIKNIFTRFVGIRTPRTSTSTLIIHGRILVTAGSNFFKDERLSNGYQKIDNFDCEDDDDEIEFCTNLRQKINEEANICAEVVPNSYRKL